MSFVFSLWDIGLWLAASSVIMLVAVELLSPYLGRINTIIDIKKLKRVAIASGMIFLAIATTRLVYLIKQYGIGLLTLELLFGIYLLLLSNSVDINLPINNITQTSVDSAFNNVRQAEIAGADVSNLVVRFNDALKLLQQAQLSLSKSCSSYSNCTEDAQEIFSSIITESASYREHAEHNSYNKIMMTFAIYAPLGAFMISLFALYSYKSWRSYQIKKFLDLEVKEKRN